jgi:hypothetical protein
LYRALVFFKVFHSLATVENTKKNFVVESCLECCCCVVEVVV